MNIVIVKSAAKAKTINKYLGSDYKVIASYGHVRDLPREGRLSTAGPGFRHGLGRGHGLGKNCE